MADAADIKKVAEEAAKARLSNNGQKCNSSKRFLVREPEYDEFCRYFTEYVNSLEIGDPSLESTAIGPMAKKELVQEIHSQVEKTIAE